MSSLGCIAICLINQRQIISFIKDSCLSCILLQPPSGEDTSSTSGIVTSPNHPRDYPSLSDCMWKLIAPKSFFISLRFLADVNIENGKDCRFDYLDIFLLDSHEQPLVGKKRLCGNVSASVLNAELMSDVELHTQTVVIQFHSDSWYSGAGFQLGYTLQGEKTVEMKIIFCMQQLLFM